MVKFLWAEGQIELTQAAATNHLNLLQRMMEKKKIPHGQMPTNYVGGKYFLDSGQLKIIWAGGNYPSEDELRFLLRQEIDKYEDPSDEYGPANRWVYSATVEDTEPEYNFGFLKDPHDALYPAAFDGEKMRPEAAKKIKAHVLNSIEEDDTLKNADFWMYFTVYGSGASYNWDEDGDFDVQMWIDIDKYHKQNPDAPMESEDLLAAVRRQTQLVNFPSFSEIGLTQGCEGKMLIQYYPKLGTGTKEENLASKPYACYDMEQMEWLFKPEPITVDFYGEGFEMVQSKAQDIAQQADDLIASLQRNILNWQFWTRLYEHSQEDQYQKTIEKAKNDAISEQKGIITLFQGVFGGRQKAYSPEGKGIEDERDLTQKMLEVWGIFQKLKHYARIPLPWEEQELPDAPEKTAGENYDHKNYGPASWQEDEGRSYPFAYVENQMLVGRKGEFHSELIADKFGWHDYDEDTLLDQVWNDSGAGRFDHEGNLFLYGNPRKSDFDWAREQLKLGPADSDIEEDDE